MNKKRNAKLLNPEGVERYECPFSKSYYFEGFEN
jgi:hypothetical protein